MRKRFFNLLALTLAISMLITAVPIFAVGDADSTAVPAPEQTADASGNVSSEDSQSFMVGENGEIVELGDNFDYDAEIAKQEQQTAELAVSGYDVMDVKISDDAKLAEWNPQIVSASGTAGSTSTIGIVSDPDKGQVAQLSKLPNAGGAITNGSYSSSDDLVSIQHPIIMNDGSPYSAEGTISIVANVNITKAGRLGMYVGNDEHNALETPVQMLKVYSFDNSKANANPLTTASERFQAIGYLNGASTKFGSTSSTEYQAAYVDAEGSKASVNKWQEWRIDVDTVAGTYDFYIDGKRVFKGIPTFFTGRIDYVGFEIQADKKSLGTMLVEGVKVTDTSISSEDEYKAKIDAASLAFPNGFNSAAVDNDFNFAADFKNGSSVSWESSNASIASVDATNHVTINNPPYDGTGGKDVTLTATVKNGSGEVTKTFSFFVVEAQPSSGAEKVAYDVEQLEITGVDLSKVSENFYVPTVCLTYGSTVTWTSTNEAIAKVDNATGLVTVTRPAYTGSGTVSLVLNAVVSNSGATAKKAFDVAVVENEPRTDAEKAAAAAENLEIAGIDSSSVKASFYLTGSADYNSTVTWKSSNTDVIKITEDTYEDEEGNTVPNEAGGFAANVTRPDRDSKEAVVTLTATVVCGGQKATRDFTVTVKPEDALKAYPGVEGYGAYSTGGRGGMVYHVTNLNAYGPGSLAYGLEELQGPRTIVFDVGGVIDLTSRGLGTETGEIALKGEKGSNITIAGQTAPYPGITLKGYGITLSKVHDVIIRHLRIRPGDVRQEGRLYEADPMSIGNSKNIIIDHCSMQWGIDMTFRVTGEYVTLSNSIFAKTLMANSPHTKGAHSYAGMINEGAYKVSFLKNMVGDSTQRSPRLTDTNYVDAYNNLLYNCGNGFDLYNYEYQNRNSKMNVYNNYARKGPSLSNATPYRAGRGRAYAGGIMAYFKNNYGIKSDNKLQSQATKHDGISKVLTFGSQNSSYGANYDLTNVTLDEWDNNPLSYDNNGKSSTAATFTYMDYPFPAPRGEVITEDSVINGEADDDKDLPQMPKNLLNYMYDHDEGAGATKPTRDLYDQMSMREVEGNAASKATLSSSVTSAYFDELEKRTGEDYSEYKVDREWNVIQGAGPTLKGADSSNPKPLHWDDHPDVRDTSKYNPNGINFYVGNWWGEYCGFPGEKMTYSLYDNIAERILEGVSEEEYQNLINDPKREADRQRFGIEVEFAEDGTVNVINDGILTEDDVYVESRRTVAELYPTQDMYNKYPEIAAYMDYYRQKNYSGVEDTKEISWDSMGDGIPDWFKEAKGWDTKKALNKVVDPETGYTYLEIYLSFAAGDEEADIDTSLTKAENFKTNNIGYATAQVFFNTFYRTTAVIEYGTEPGKYTKSEALRYTRDTDYYNTYHSITLTNLEPNTTYYYKITTTDELGDKQVVEYNANDSKAKKMTFTTAPATSEVEDPPSKPVITNVTPYIDWIRLNWTGDVATDDRYEIWYDTKPGNGVESNYANKITGDDLKLSNLDIKDLKYKMQGIFEEGKTYYFVVVAVNENGKTASDEVNTALTNVVLEYNFPKMSAAEKDKYMKEKYMYDLGGKWGFADDPDTGDNILMMMNEAITHGSNTYFNLPVTQTDVFTFELKFKLYYQKMMDALDKGMGESNEHDVNHFQVVFLQDPAPNEDLDSTDMSLTDTAFSLYFQSTSKDNGDGVPTTETNELNFVNEKTTTIATGYSQGKTINDPGYTSQTQTVGVLPPVHTFAYSNYNKKNSKIQDAIYGQCDGKEAWGLWYYQPKSAEFIDLKVVCDPANNDVKVYIDGEEVYAGGTFHEDGVEPFNIGRIQIKSRNNGYMWAGIQSLKVTSGDGKMDPDIDDTPVGNIPSGGIGGGGNVPKPTTDPNATEAPSTDPNATEEPNATTAPSGMFNDLGDVEWAVEAIESLAKDGVVNGTSANTFEPNRQITRAEYLAMLMRSYDLIDETATSAFTDVTANDWFYSAVSSAAKLGIVAGNEDGSFGANDPITRQDMMVMTYRALQVISMPIPVNREYSDFADQASVGGYATEAVKAMYCAEVINGKGDGILDPLGLATRAESAKVIYEIVNLGGTK